MTQSLVHRGPDDQGKWVDPEHGIALGHRRLAIVDLKDTGHQPMISASHRFILIFNGEIYNYLDLRDALDQTTFTSWRGHSDTEVMLRGFEVWGIQATLDKLSGMFAFALWDQVEKKLYLARDRLGEKPLYYGWAEDSFVFGSELKALRTYPDAYFSIDPQALCDYLSYGYVPSPCSIYQHIFKLTPGTFLTVGLKDVQEKTIPLPQAFWRYRDFVYAPKTQKTFEESSLEFEDLLKKVVSQQMISDVPIGAFLSGGVDSSLIAAMMRTVHSGVVKTYSIGFEDSGYDEAQYAKAVAHHLGTDHTEFYVTDQEARNVIPQLSSIYDEPFADSSQIPTFLVSQIARRHVTVALSGDGGDEIFGGYNRYRFAQQWENLQGIPPFLQNIIARIFSGLSSTKIEEALHHLFFLKTKRIPQIGDKLQKLASVLGKKPDVVYETLVRQSPLEERVLKDRRLESSFVMALHPLDAGSFTEKMMYADVMTYLPDDILVKVDRAAMAVSLETRAPFLDRQIVEFAAHLPLSFKLEGKKTKRILRNVLYKHVPPGLIERPKQGFGIPLASWLRGPLKQWAEDLLDPKALAAHDFFDEKQIAAAWQQHISREKNHAYKLWTILMFQAWSIKNQ